MKFQLSAIAAILALITPTMCVSFIALILSMLNLSSPNSLADAATGAGENIAAREPSHEDLMFAARDVLNTIERLNARDETYKEIYARDLDSVNELKARELLAEMLAPLVRRKQPWSKSCPDCGKVFYTEAAFLGHAYDGCGRGTNRRH